MSLRLRYLAAFAMLGIASAGLHAQSDAEQQRALRHANPDWALIAPHLPDPATATPAMLMLEGDVLRARRFNEDALEFYQAALKRGGEEAVLMNRMGVLELTLQQPALARSYFHRALTLRPKDAAAWNNLGATEFLADQFHPALSDYARAVKLDKRNAVFHANLGTAYFELKDYESAQKEFSTAFKLDRSVFQRDGNGGIQARVLTASDRGRFAFEMARIAARQGDEAGMLQWLTKACDDNFDIHAEMSGKREFAPYLADSRVLLILQNARAMRATHGTAVAAVEPLPARKD